MNKYLSIVISLLLLNSACSNSEEDNKQVESTPLKPVEEVAKHLPVIEILNGQWKTKGNEGVVPKWLEFNSSENSYYSWLDEEKRPTEIDGSFKIIGDSIIELLHAEYKELHQFRINSINKDVLDIVSMGVSAGNLVYKKTEYVEKEIQQTEIDTTPVVGILKSIEESDFWGRKYLYVNVDGKTKVYDYYAEDFSETRKLIGKKIVIKFRVEETLQELDLHLNNKTIHGKYGRVKAEEQTNGNGDSKIEGTLLIHKHDRSGDLPSDYRIIDNNGDTTTITAFVYDSHIELNGKKATVYYMHNIDYIVKYVGAFENNTSNTIASFVGSWKKEDSSSPIDPTYFKIHKDAEHEYSITFGNEDYSNPVEHTSNTLQGNSSSGKFVMELISGNPLVISYSDDGRGGHFNPNTNVRFIKEKE